MANVFLVIENNIARSYLFRIAPLAFTIISYFMLAIFSLSRTKMFSGIDDYDSRELGVIFLIFIILSASYFLLVLKVSEIRIIHILIVAITVFLLSLIMLPILSTDILSYVISGRNITEFHNNPYVVPIGFPKNPWSKEISGYWWSAFPTPYGPAFMLVSSISTLLSFDNIFTAVYTYKIVNIIFYLGSVYLFYKINKLLNGANDAIYLLLLNPAIIFHLLIDAHNEVITIFFLLAWLYLFQIRIYWQGFLVYLMATLVKFTTLVLVPIFFIKMVLSKKLLIILVITVVLLVLITYYLMTANSSSYSFLWSWCFSGCTPIVRLSQLSFGDHAEIARFVLFLPMYLIILYRYLIKEQNYIKCCFWILIIFYFVFLRYLPPWYLTVTIYLSLLLTGLKYRFIMLLLTTYSLAHFFGI